MLTDLSVLKTAISHHLLFCVVTLVRFPLPNILFQGCAPKQVPYFVGCPVLLDKTSPKEDIAQSTPGEHDMLDREYVLYDSCKIDRLGQCWNADFYSMNQKMLYGVYRRKWTDVDVVSI
jgi:hypothetical protein